jgi:cell shape-determining protein MreC
MGGGSKMTNEQINAASFEAIKQRDQAREHYDRIYQKLCQTETELKSASEFIKALEKENEELREEVGSLMFMTEIMQKEINKLQK